MAMAQTLYHAAACVMINAITSYDVLVVYRVLFSLLYGPDVGL